MLIFCRKIQSFKWPKYYFEDNLYSFGKNLVQLSRGPTSAGTVQQTRETMMKKIEGVNGTLKYWVDNKLKSSMGGIL